MPYPQKKLLTIFHKTNGHCFYCGSKKAYEVDHFFPNKIHSDYRLDGYTDNNSTENLFLSCKKCNARKNDTHPEDFIGDYFTAWRRYNRANYRVGLSVTREYD